MPEFGLHADRPAVFERVLADDALAARPCPRWPTPQDRLGRMPGPCNIGALRPITVAASVAARPLYDNSRCQGSPSIPQLALVMPTGSQRSAASAGLNDRKCQAAATTISA